MQTSIPALRRRSRPSAKSADAESSWKRTPSTAVITKPSCGIPRRAGSCADPSRRPLSPKPRRKEAEAAADAREKRLQEAALEIKERFGKNAMIKGMNLEEGGTTNQRNGQVGGHRV